MSEDMLEEMMRLQRELQIEAYGKDISAGMGDTERIELIKTNILALTDELHEALNETGWKPWATSRHVNEQALQGELIDAWHFLMNLFMLAGLEPWEVRHRYVAKRQKNINRQAEGYDGVSTKCPGCGRALDDDGVFCTLHESGQYAYCRAQVDKYDPHVFNVRLFKLDGSRAE